MPVVERLAIVLAIVPLPAPDGPSIAMMSLFIGLRSGQSNMR